MKGKLILLHLLIAIGYFLLLLWWTWKVSGGDMVLALAVFAITVFHVLIIVILFFREKKRLVQALVGLVIALMIDFLIFKIIVNQKSRIGPSVTTMIVSGHSITGRNSYA